MNDKPDDTTPPEGDRPDQDRPPVPGRRRDGVQRHEGRDQHVRHGAALGDPGLQQAELAQVEERLALVTNSVANRFISGWSRPSAAVRRRGS